MVLPGNVALKSTRWFEGRCGELFISSSSSRSPLEIQVSTQLNVGLELNIRSGKMASVLVF